MFVRWRNSLVIYFHFSLSFPSFFRFDDSIDCSNIDSIYTTGQKCLITCTRARWNGKWNNWSFLIFVGWFLQNVFQFVVNETYMELYLEISSSWTKTIVLEGSFFFFIELIILLSEDILRIFIFWDINEMCGLVCLLVIRTKLNFYTYLEPFCCCKDCQKMLPYVC